MLDKIAPVAVVVMAAVYSAAGSVSTAIVAAASGEVLPTTLTAGAFTAMATLLGMFGRMVKNGSIIFIDQARRDAEREKEKQELRELYDLSEARELALRKMLEKMDRALKESDTREQSWQEAFWTMDLMSGVRPADRRKAKTAVKKTAANRGRRATD